VIKTAVLSLFALACSYAQAPVFADRDARYRLQPNDVIETNYRYTPEFNQEVKVQPDGFVNLQLIGDLKVAGMTVEEARKAIAEKAGERLRDPELQLVLKEFELPHFVVGGEVGNPGKFEMHGEVTAIQAIAMAGGLKESSKHSQVLLLRRVSPDLAETKLLNLKKMMDAGDRQEDVALRPGDILVVPKNRLSKIERVMKWANVGIFWNPVQR
jgi:polysaccharide biosynthesis/export protein